MDSTTIFISSAQCTAKSAIGSTITIDLKNPIDTYGKHLRVLSSSFWYSFPNVSENLGNQTIKFTYNSVVHTLTLPKGIYSLTDIMETVGEQLETLGLDKDLFTLIPDEATAKVTMKVKPAYLFVMTMSDPLNVLFADYLGFTDVCLTPAATVFYYESTNRAALNLHNALYINCSIATGNYFNERSGSNIIATVPLNRAPNTLIYTENSIPVVSKSTGSLVSKFQLWITDENSALLDMGGEDWTLVLDIF